MNLSISNKLKAKLKEEERERLDLMLMTLETISERPLIFKGGSALTFFYGSDRLSEDLDFDCQYPITAKSLQNILKKIGKAEIKKDTYKAKKVILERNGVKLKVEISLRHYNPQFEPIEVKNQLKVYNINDLFIQKLSAFLDRTVARDLYDIGFILSAHFSRLSMENLEKFFKYFKTEDMIYELISRYENVFEENKILTESHLLLSVERILKAYRTYKEVSSYLRKENQNRHKE